MSERLECELEMFASVRAGEVPLGVFADCLGERGSPRADAARWLAENLNDESDNDLLSGWQLLLDSSVLPIREGDQFGFQPVWRETVKGLDRIPYHHLEGDERSGWGWWYDSIEEAIRDVRHAVSRHSNARYRLDGEPWS